MDTKFWGPDGWRLLHTLAYIYPSKPTQQQQYLYNIFFDMLKDILPCRYCRESFKNFMKELPIKPYLNSPRNLRLWIYRIHNKVNNKLRRQGLLHTKNPTLHYVDNLYSRIIKDGAIKSFKLNTGWDFLYSIVYNYDPKQHSPMIYEQWFNILAEISPCELFKTTYVSMSPIKNALESDATFQRWFYEFHKNYLNNGLNVSCPSFSKVCERYESIKVPSCINKPKTPPAIPTCRRSPST
jgi:hypothetical protein